MTEIVSDVVASRYGSKRSKKRDRRLGWTVGVIAAIGGIMVIVFGGWQQETTEMQNIGFTLQNTENADGVYSASTKFEVNADPGLQVSCAVEALNTSKATVGWKVIDLPVIDDRSQIVTVDVLTLGPATAAHAKACWSVTD